MAAVIAAGLGWPAHPAGTAFPAENDHLPFLTPILLTPILGNDYAPYASVETGAAFVKLHEWVFREPGSDAKISAIDYNMGFNGGFRLGLGFEPYNKLKKIGLGISGVGVYVIIAAMRATGAGTGSPRGSSDAGVEPGNPCNKPRRNKGYRMGV